MSALENVVLAAVIAGALPWLGRAEASACGLLDLLGLSEKGRTGTPLPSRAASVSGFRSQGLSSMSQPSLLADEPTGALDSTGAMEVLELFRRLHADGQTILLVTLDDRDVADGRSASSSCATGVPRRKRAGVARSSGEDMTWLLSGSACAPSSARDGAPGWR